MTVMMKSAITGRRVFRKRYPRYVCLRGCNAGAYARVDVRGSATISVCATASIDIDEKGDDMNNPYDVGDWMCNGELREQSLEADEYDDWERFENEVYCKRCNEECEDTDGMTDAEVEKMVREELVINRL